MQHIGNSSFKNDTILSVTQWLVPMLTGNALTGKLRCLNNMYFSSPSVQNAVGNMLCKGGGLIQISVPGGLHLPTSNSKHEVGNGCFTTSKVFKKQIGNRFRLNVMVVGESGLGKTTFMNTLFNTDLVSEIVPEEPTKTVKISPITYELIEGKTTLQLTIIDTPGFGDRLDRSEDINPLIRYIENQYQAYWDAEKISSVRKPTFDTRVHVCLYFISPSGHSLKAHDVLALQKLSSRVNVIPIIAKADTMTQREKKLFKQTILQDLSLHAIPIYPTAYSELHETLEHLEQHIPFTVIGSEVGLQKDEKPIRGRQYDWGIVEVENENHCDFIHLREILFITCLAELVEITHARHYHDYRVSHLRKDGRPPSILECDEEYDRRIEDARKSISERLQRKDEEIRQNFVQLARHQELALRKKEEKLQMKHKELMEDIERERASLASEEEAFLQTLESRQSVKAGKRS